MTGTVGRLRAVLGLDASPFNRGLNQARGSAGVFSAGVRRMMAGVGVAIAGAFSTAAIRNAMGMIDAQAKLAKSLGTTSASMQVLARAGDLAGVSMQGIEQGTKDLFRRLSQAASGTGPAADALKRLKLTAGELLKLPLDQRLAKINGAIREFVPEAQRAAVAGALFGEEGSIALSRLDPGVIAQATEELQKFGFAISETDAAKIEAANDSISKLGLIAQGLVSQITVALAPALDSIAQGFANAMRAGGPLREVIQFLGENIGRLATYAATFAALMAGQWVAGMAAAALATASLSGALALVRTAIMRTGIGLLIVGAGELVVWFSRLVKGAGGFGEAMGLLGDVAAAVWEGIKSSAKSIPPALAGVWQQMKGDFLKSLSDMATKFHDFVWTIANGMSSIPGLEGISDNLFDLARGASEVSGTLHAAGAAAEASAASSYAAAAGVLKDAFGPAREAMEKLREVMRVGGEDAETALDDAAGSADKLAEALAGSGGDGKGGASGAGGRALDKLKTKAEKLKETTQEVRETFKSAFVGLVTGATKFKAALSEVLGKLAEMAASRAFDMLFGGGRTGGSRGRSGGGLFGGLFRGILGSIIPGFATGTSNAPGGLAMVGERGRELVNLPRGAQVIPNGRTEEILRGRAASQSQVNIVPSPYFDAVVDRRAGVVAGAMDQSLARQSRDRFPGMQRAMQSRGTTI